MGINEFKSDESEGEYDMEDEGENGFCIDFNIDLGESCIMWNFSKLEINQQSSSEKKTLLSTNTESRVFKAKLITF